MAFSSSYLHAVRPMGDYLVAYRPDEKQYIGLTLMPIKTVKHRADQIRKENKGNLLRLMDLRVGPNGGVREHQFKMDASVTYSTVQQAVMVVLSRDEQSDADDELTYVQRQIDHGMQVVLTTAEYVQVKKIGRTAGNYGSNAASLNAGQRFDEQSNSQDILVLFRTICDRIESATSHRPTDIFLHSMVWSQIINHPSVRGRSETQQGGGGIMTKELFEKILDLPKGAIKTTSAVYNTAQEGAADDFRSFIGPDVIFAYNEPGKINTYGLGSTFVFSGVTDPAGMGTTLPGPGEIALPAGNFALRAYDDPRYGLNGATICKIGFEFDTQMLNSSAGYLLKNVVNYTDAQYGGFLNN